VYLYGSEVLRKKAKPVTELSNDHLKLIVDMFETMRQADGVGLAANQVGSLERIIVIDVSEAEGYEEIKPIALINPEIIWREGEQIGEEGCLSIPGIRNEVARPAAIKVRYRDTNFNLQELEAHDMYARVILHETDHLNGIVFLDHLTSAERKEHKEQIDQIRRGDVETEYPVSTTAAVLT